MTESRAWVRDPLIWLGALFAAGAHAWVFFAGEYLPYIDYASHVGLISILAHGDETGALQYFSRSWAPNPYSLFYFVSALLAQALPVVVAAKLALVVASGSLTLAAAELAEVHGRDARLGLIAPMATFGYALGYGFASFVFAMPTMLFALAALERLLRRLLADRLDLQGIVWAAWPFAALLCLTYLGHALIFLATSFVVLVRVLAFAWARRTRGLRALMLYALVLLGAGGPVIGLGALRLLLLAAEPERVTETTPSDPNLAWLEFPAFASRFSHLPHQLLFRGPAGHMNSMYAVLALFVFLLLLSWRRRNSALHLSYGYPAVLLGFLALYALGPDAINKPFSVWLFYSRFATLTALAIFLLPRVRLSGLVGVLVGVLELSVLAYDASQQRVHVVNFNQVAQQYDAVRAAVPPRKRILALTYGTAAGDPMVGHPNLRTLYFYHLADGAAYVAYLFDNPLIPVRYRHDVAAPEAPFWRTPYTFDPKVHGREFDLLILRGAPVDRAKKSKDHRLLREVNGWSIFETLEPPPWPSGRGPDAPG
jgi:hypothetical protein